MMNNEKEVKKKQRLNVVNLVENKIFCLAFYSVEAPIFHSNVMLVDPTSGYFFCLWTFDIHIMSDLILSFAGSRRK